MSKVTVAKALNLKNRLAERVEALKTTLKLGNTQLSDIQSNSVSFSGARALLSVAVQCLVEVKRSVATANQTMWADIFLLAELKGVVKAYKSLPVSPEKVMDPYKREYVNYRNNLSKEEIEKIVREYERTIDEMQQKLDHFNHTTFVEVDMKTVDSVL